MKYMKLKLIIGLSFALALVFFAMAATAQNQDANPYGGIYYNDHSNYRMYGANGLPRTDHTNLDTLTNVLKGDLRFDTLNTVVVVYDGSAWVDLVAGGSNTLGQAYDEGGAGLGREIDATDGAVWVSGEDGFIVTGTYGSGEDIEYEGGVTGDVTMYFNPKKGAFRAGYADLDEWDNANVGDYSFSVGVGNIASGATSTAMGGSSVASGLLSFAIGGQSTASGENAISIGNVTTSIGKSSTSIGNNITSESYSETAIGLYNTDYTPTSTTTWEATDRLFVIGNGQSLSTRSDALIIQKNGNLTMPTTTGAFSPPVLTTTQRDALTAVAGMIIYNSTTGQHEGYDGAWNAMY